MALIPPFFTDCVLAIGESSDEGPQWCASGFLYGSLRRQVDDERVYGTYIVTNKHVLEGIANPCVRFNRQLNEPAVSIPIDLKTADAAGRPRWYGHPDPDVDVAVIPVSFGAMRSASMQVDYFRGDVAAAGLGRLRKLGVTEGDGVFVLGFPMGLTGEYRNTVIVRTGCIARIRDVLDGHSKEFLVDATVFPGNSGGPVILTPEITAIEGTQPQSSSLLIGVVSGYVPYSDVAVSRQTKKPRVIFEENSGLSAVHPVDCIDEIIALHVDALTEEELASPSLSGGGSPVSE